MKKFSQSAGVLSSGVSALSSDVPAAIKEETSPPGGDESQANHDVLTGIWSRRALLGSSHGAERIRAAIAAAPMIVNHSEIFVTISIGATALGAEACEKRLLTAADARSLSG